jgi:hypothetical protein
VELSNEDFRLCLLLRHVNHVESNLSHLADLFIANGEKDFARDLLYRGRVHDASKFYGIEWEHLHDRTDPLFERALKQHQSTNSHHPEFHEHGIHDMGRLDLAEMVADWASRASELKGKGLIQWVEENATNKFGFTKGDRVYNEVYEFVDLLMEPAFA